MANAEVVRDAPSVEECSEFLDAKLTVPALIIVNRSMLAPVLLVLKEYFIEAIVVDV